MQNDKQNQPFNCGMFHVFPDLLSCLAHDLRLLLSRLGVGRALEPPDRSSNRGAKKASRRRGSSENTARSLVSEVARFAPRCLGLDRRGCTTKTAKILDNRAVYSYPEVFFGGGPLERKSLDPLGPSKHLQTVVERLAVDSSTVYMTMKQIYRPPICATHTPRKTYSIFMSWVFCFFSRFAFLSSIK